MTAATIDVSPAELAIIRAILQQVVPERRVWAFGSRVTGRAKRFSDLDLVIVGSEPLPFEVLTDLADAFMESNLPFKVDLVDWATTTPVFQQIIEASYLAVK